MASLDVGVKTSTSLLVLDLREPTGPPADPGWVLGKDAVCGDGALPDVKGGVGAAEFVGGGFGYWAGRGSADDCVVL